MSHKGKATIPLLAIVLACSAQAGTIHGITYNDLDIGTNTDLTSAGTLDWVKWGNGGTSGNPNYATPEKLGGSIINTELSPLGTVPPGQSVLLVQFDPSPNPSILDFNWTDGTEAMHDGGPVGTSVSETITPAQFSYPNGLGLSLTAQADAAPLTLNVFVIGFNTRMLLNAVLSGGGNSSLLAADAELVGIHEGPAFNYFTAGFFSITYSGAGETLTINLTANNQVGVPTNATQYGFRNAGISAATVVPGSVVPEPATLATTLLGLAGLALGRRRWTRRQGLPV